MATKIVIYQDNQSLLTSLATLLHNRSDYEVAGYFQNLLNVQDEIKVIRPDVVMLDIDFPSKDGISAIPIIKLIDPNISVVIYTQFEDEEKIFSSLCAGADGYILKKISTKQILIALNEVRSGGAPLSPVIARKVLQSFHLRSSTRYNLTHREIEVLKLLIKGCSVKFIASELDVAYETCRSHLKNIYSKLHVNCGKEAIARIMAERIIL